MKIDRAMAQLEKLVAHYEELRETMADPEVINDAERYMEIPKEGADIHEVVQKHRKCKSDIKEIGSDKEITSSEPDDNLVGMTKEEDPELEKGVAKSEDEIKILMLPKDPDDDKGIVMEIRRIAGEDEASLFTGDPLRMYEKYAEA